MPGFTVKVFFRVLFDFSRVEVALRSSKKVNNGRAEKSEKQREKDFSETNGRTNVASSKSLS